MKKLINAIFVCFIIIFIGCSSTRGVISLDEEQGPLVVFLVRHAEKADLGRDPELSDYGHKRARLLGGMLRSAKIEYVHSSNYIRSKDTAAPTAEIFGLEVALYDPRELSSLVEELHNRRGRHLVVGHSNTTPPLVKMLGGDPGSDINEEREYDRLYIVTIKSDGKAGTVLIRYGKPYNP